MLLLLFHFQSILKIFDTAEVIIVSIFSFFFFFLYSDCLIDMPLFSESVMLFYLNYYCYQISHLHTLMIM